MQQPGQQPNIPTMVQAMNTLRDQLQRLANVPGIVDGQAIAAAITAQTQHFQEAIAAAIAAQTQHFQAQFQRINSRFVTPPFCPLDYLLPWSILN